MRLNRVSSMQTSRFLGMLRMMSGLSVESFGWTALMLGGLGAGLAFLMYVRFHLLWSLPFVLLALIGPLVGLYALVRYVSYRNWRDNLPYEFNGDFEIFERPDNDSDTWRLCSIEIHAPHVDRAQLVLIRDSIVGFVERANRKIYNTRWGRITRWQLESPLSAVGQVNLPIAWKMYKFLSGELARLGRSGIKITSVHLKVAEHAEIIPAESTTFNQ
ncbi:MAG: hypothetical protein KDK34_06865 [Leptospiraceae bacterium]|nr:hypothetical protein [Leptospiraceae bacterium]MCB1319954.1 hypothetical protein [Leptospiraceae bacterium]